MKNLLHKLLPKKYKLKKITKKFGKIFFSQDGEDMAINAFYETMHNYKGFFIDVGAHHPYRFSNTAFFYLRGWNGINIEPTPSLFDDFIKHRKRDINLNFGVSEKKSMLTFYEFDEPALNSFDKILSQKRNLETNYKIIAEKQIEVFPLSEILDNYLPKNQKIDFITIDVEGLDFQVLKSNNWEKYRPTFVLVEDQFDFNDLKSNQIYSYLTQLNYSLVAKTLRTNIFKSDI